MAKFGDHLPFYRQADIYARQGINLDRATLGNWVGRACFHLKPIIDRMRWHLKGADRVFMDETRAQVLDPGRRQTKTGFFWAIVSDDRGHGSSGPPVILFHYAPGRGAVHALKFLDGYRGRFLQCDGYEVYDKLTGIDRTEGPWQIVHCWTHVRRRFVKRLQSDGSPIAEEALRQIRQLYAVEASVRGLAPEIRLAARQELSKPILTAFRPWLEAQLSRIPRSSTLAEDIRYTLGFWSGLNRLVESGQLEMDTNSVKDQMRRVALTRKNALFAGKHVGAEHWAMLASLEATCKMSNVNPVAYIAETLRAILDGHPKSRIEELMPWNFRKPSSRAHRGSPWGLDLAAVMDWCTRRVLAWCICNTLEADLCLEALNEAIHKFGPPEITNTDQGKQFTSLDWTHRLKRAKTKISMYGKTRYLDNIFIKRLWQSLKYECVYLYSWETGSQAKAGVGRWITLYNHLMPHAAHGGQPPAVVYANETETDQQI